MRAVSSFWLLTYTAVLPLSCTVQDIDLSRMQCPCLAGWSCDSVCNTCVRNETDRAAIQVTDLRADWVTPNAIHWAWNITGNEKDFHVYEVLVARSKEDLCDGVNVRHWTVADNPELARFTIPNSLDQVFGTIVDQLDPNTEYFAQLLATDTVSRVSRSDIVGTRTPPKFIDEFVIFSEDPVSPEALPFYCAEIVDDAPYAAEHHVQFELRCDDEPKAVCVEPEVSSQTCWVNVGWSMMPLSFPHFSETKFLSSYLEFALAIVGPDPSFWSEVSLRTGDGRAKTYAPLTFKADGAYRLYQIKLSAFLNRDDSTPMTFEQIQNPLDMFLVGLRGADRSIVRFDEVRIKW